MKNKIILILFIKLYKGFNSYSSNVINFKYIF